MNQFLRLRTFRIAATYALSVLLCFGSAAAFAEQHVVAAKLAQATVTMSVPKSMSVGDAGTLHLRVAPVPGAMMPVRVRARLGMPNHGHWVSEEANYPFSTDELQFDAEIPMHGRYRFRVWLDFDGGDTVRTGVDFDLNANDVSMPVVVK